MPEPVIKVEQLYKQYRLGLVGTGTLSNDLTRWWYRLRGLEDPFQRLGELNDRSIRSDSNYVWALQDINLEVTQGEVLGIIGKNGAGKSTLLKILSRVTGPTFGTITYRGRIGALLEVGTGFHPELTGKENIYLNGAVLGMTRAEVKRKLDAIVAFSGCARYIDTPVKRYSSGMKVRLGFAVAAHLEPEILVVDEVLAVGDAEFQKKALGKIKDISTSDERTILFVSHNMGAIKSICTRVILLDNGVIIASGSSEEIVRKYHEICSRLDENMSLKIKTAQEGFRLGKIELFNQYGPTQSFEAGSSLKIAIDIECDYAIEELRIGIGINSVWEERLSLLDSYVDNQTITVKQGRQTIICEIPKLPLAVGSYLMDVKILRNYSIPLIKVPPQLTFSVIEGNFYTSGRLPNYKWAGKFYIDHKWYINK